MSLRGQSLPYSVTRSYAPDHCGWDNSVVSHLPAGGPSYEGMTGFFERCRRRSSGAPETSENTLYLALAPLLLPLRGHAGAQNGSVPTTHGSSREGVCVVFALAFPDANRGERIPSRGLPITLLSLPASMMPRATHVEAGNLGHSLAGDALQVAHLSDRRVDSCQELRLKRDLVG